MNKQPPDPKYKMGDTVYIFGKEEIVACICWDYNYPKKWSYGIESCQDCSDCFPEDEVNNFSLSQILKGLIDDE